ncbi:MAG: hypothetical protein GY822_21200 [Deltaproteobacteria bacterium]|nr:hypothetical protein [Deltaproteobacteria bacterium]
MSLRQWTIRFFRRDDVSKVAKLLSAVAGFDSSVEAKSESWLSNILEHPSVSSDEQWSVAEAKNGAMVGVCLSFNVGTTRTEVVVAVNPAWRRQGIGKTFIESLPKKRRFLIDTKASVVGATAWLKSAGFEERYRHKLMRREVGSETEASLPSWASIEDDRGRDAQRFRTTDLLVNGEDAETEMDAVKQKLQRAGTRILYMQTPKGDDGYALLVASEWCKKDEFDRNGAPTIGVLEHIGLSKSVRGKGLSRPLLRTALMGFAEDGYAAVEVLADARRQAAVELYVREGFSEYDEVIHWIRRDA